MITLHLKTQRGQPYGSERRCCERCGTMIWPGMHDENNLIPRWTDDPKIWNKPPEGFEGCGA